MFRLEDIASGTNLEGIEPSAVVTVAAVLPIQPGALTVIYRLPDGTLRERLLSRADEAGLHAAARERPWAFDGDAASFQLAIEAKRIDLAYLFDPMMAVHTSNVEPLPHQITAVYEAMLPRQPLRFILADDPGAGKTIMAGLYMRELILRSDACRILVVAPGGLVEQWRDELFEKFGLEFRVFSHELELASPSGNPFEDHPFLIARLDQMARSDGYAERLAAAGYDLVVFDEAHKLSAHFFGREVERTRRFLLAQKLSAACRHLLLMTATPHNGKDEDFELFLSLLDNDRFAGRARSGAGRPDNSDLMRRMVKEELVKFDGTPLFPERRAYTVNYKLSALEAILYDEVTRYVTEEMGKAEKLDGTRRGSVGFALTTLQRRLASSPAAICRSLERRLERLEKRLAATRAAPLPVAPPSVEDDLPEDDDDITAGEQEALEERIVDDASAARTIGEFENEIAILKDLARRARDVVVSGCDRKWEELSRILQDDPLMRDADGRQRKLIVFSEHRDTLDYLQARIAGVLGRPEAVVVISGGTARDERRRLQEAFRFDPDVRVLVATDAAGEGVNLQNANLMVNYDLPWNPNRLEQRFGRIHRIGQQEVCHLWNLVAPDTREGDVYHRLLEKLRIEGKALKGRVFDVLGEVFEGTSLKDLLLDAIRYGDRPDVRARLYRKVDDALDFSRLREILDRDALARESMTPERLFAVRETMEKAEARRLQPFFVRSFFLRAFEAVGGSIHPRESGRFEVTHVPASVRERAPVASSPSVRAPAPVLKRYERICFSREAVRPTARPGLALASLVHPGHPLMRAISDLVLDRNGNLLRQGAVLVDPADEGREPWLMVTLAHEVRSGDHRVLSRRLQFVRLPRDGVPSFAGYAPHLDLEPPAPGDAARVEALRNEPWLSTDPCQRALAYAAATLVPEHLQEAGQRQADQVDRTLAAVHDRLTREIAFWSDRWMKLKDDLAAGIDARLNIENARRTVLDLEGRLENRRAELKRQRFVSSSTPVVIACALVVPRGLLDREDAQPSKTSGTFAADPEARRRIERIAMEAVRRAEEARGCRVVDVSAEKCGWDLTSYPPSEGGRTPPARHIEVKGRIRGASTLTVTRNEILCALNQADKFVLAIVGVHEDGSGYDGPWYVRNPFDTEPGWGVASWNVEIDALLTRAERM